MRLFYSAVIVTACLKNSPHPHKTKRRSAKIRRTWHASIIVVKKECESCTSILQLPKTPTCTAGKLIDSIFKIFFVFEKDLKIKRKKSELIPKMSYKDSSNIFVRNKDILF